MAADLTSAILNHGGELQVAYFSAFHFLLVESQTYYKDELWREQELLWRVCAQHMFVRSEQKEQTKTL